MVKNILGLLVKVVKKPINSDLMGAWVPKDQTIYIHKNISKKDETKTYYHEEFHVALDRTGLSQTLNRAQIECLCELHSVLSFENNPKKRLR